MFCTLSVAWNVAYKSLFLPFSRDPSNAFGVIVVSDLWSDSLRRSKLKLAMMISMSLRKQKGVQFSEFKSNPTSNHLVFFKSIFKPIIIF